MGRPSEPSPRSRQTPPRDPAPMSQPEVSDGAQSPFPAGSDIVLTDRLDLSFIKDMKSVLPAEARARSQDALGFDEQFGVTRNDSEQSRVYHYDIDYAIKFDVNLAEIARFQESQSNFLIDRLRVQLLGENNKQPFSITETEDIHLGRLRQNSDQEIKDALVNISARPNTQVRVPVQLNFTSIDKGVLDSASRIFVQFQFFAPARNEFTIGEPRASMTFTEDVNYAEDKRVLFAVRNAIPISAIAMDYGETLIKITKTKNQRAKGVDLYRRTILKNAQTQEPFAYFRTVEFESEPMLSTAVDEDYEINVVDRGVDNSFSYVYRAIPVGFEDAPSLVFADAQTVPLDQGDVIMGENFHVSPIFDSIVRIDNVNNQPVQRTLLNRVSGYAFNDKSFLSDDDNVDKISENVTILGRSTLQGVQLKISNINSVANVVQYSLVRRNLTAGESKFLPIRLDSGNFLQSNVPVLSTPEVPSQINVTDPTVLDDNSYEYGCMLMDVFGAKQLAVDTANVTYTDLSQLGGEDIDIRALSQVNSDQNSISLTIDVTLPKNVFDFFQSITRVQPGEQEVFLGDFIQGRENLNVLPYLIVERFDTTTGRQRTFSEIGLGQDVRKFVKTSPNEPTEVNQQSLQEAGNTFGGAGENFARNIAPDQSAARNAGRNNQGIIQGNVTRTVFTDDTVEKGNEYYYEVKICLRDPLSIDANFIKTVSTQAGKFLSQPCKVRNPLFLRKGILPPTATGQNFIRQEDLQTGPRRLLNRFTSKNSYELGEVSARTLVPELDVISIAEDNPSISVTNLRNDRRYYATLQWRLGEVAASQIDRFEIIARDTYFPSNVSHPSYVRELLLHSVPANSRDSDGGTFIATDRVPRLSPGDEITFQQPRQNLDALKLQIDVENQVYGIRRQYKIIPVTLEGRRLRTIASNTIDVCPLRGSSSFIRQSISMPPAEEIAENLRVASDSIFGNLQSAIENLERLGSNVLAVPQNEASAVASLGRAGGLTARSLSVAANVARSASAYTPPGLGNNSNFDNF